MRKALIGCTIALGLQASGVAAQIGSDTYCTYEDLPRSLRQTLIVVDDAVITSETEDSGISDENNAWRNFVRQFVDASSPGIGARIAPREHVTVVVANGDGAGATQLFSGCIPVFSTEETAQLASGDTWIGKFFGKSWAKQHEDMAKDVTRSVQRELIEAGKSGHLEEGDTAFAKSGLVRSLRRMQPLDLVNGVPRIILYTDLSRYGFPGGDRAAARTAGFTDAETSDLALGFAEMHLISEAEAEAPTSEDYLNTFFLGAEADLVSQSSTDGTLSSSHPVASVRVFNGTIDYSDDVQAPARLRLTQDVNGSTINSWVTELGRGNRFVPVKGQVSCSGTVCSFTQDKSFAEVWTKNPNDATPECGNDMPFLGMRFFDFEVTEAGVEGAFKDPVCYLEGRQEGVNFHMNEVIDGRW